MDELRVDELRAERQTGSGWWQLAACRSADPELFFPVSGAGPAIEQAGAAKAVCAGCPVRRECLAYAIFTRQQHGIWGGLTESERHAAFRRAQVRRAGAHDRDSRAVS
jgi:WhiB family redox-sensing transcriptional regulator